MKVKVQAWLQDDTSKRELSFDAPIPTNLYDLIERYGSEKSRQAMTKYYIKRYQDTARRLMRQGRSDEEIRRFLRTYQP